MGVLAAALDDYAKVNIPMLPVTHGVEFTRLHVLLYTIILAIVTLLPWLTGMSGLVYLAAAVVLNARAAFVQERNDSVSVIFEDGRHWLIHRLGYRYFFRLTHQLRSLSNRN